MPIRFIAFPETDAVALLRGLWQQATCVEIVAGYFFGSGLNLLRTEIEAFLEDKNHELRILVADSYEQTDGEAVREMLAMRPDCIRFCDSETNFRNAVAPQPGGIFHPKAFCFTTPRGRRALLGSANFSYAAWKQNVEWCMLIEEDGTAAPSLNDLTQEFARLWEPAQPIAAAALQRFIELQKEISRKKEGKPVMPEWKVGEIVRHRAKPEWGLGEVKYVDGEHVGVKFEGGSVREIVANCLVAAQGPRQMLTAILSGETAPNSELYDLRTQARFLQVVHASTGVLSQARVDVLPHQMLAAHRVVSSDPPRWLVADDVGLGKTIEAGLMIAALRAKGQAERILIVVPAGLRQQWQDELREKFNMSDFALFNSAMMRQYGSDTSQIWKQMNRLIASIDTLAQEHIRETLQGSHWDLVIFDEAHKLSAYDGYYSERFNLARHLTDNATVNAFVCLSATPHQGNHSKFWHLVNLIRPDLFTKEPKWNSEKRHLPEVMMRSRKKQVTDMSGKALFPTAPVTKQIKVQLTKPELMFFGALHTYLRTGYLTAERAATSDTKLKAIGFTMTTFQKLASSSPYAIRDALLNRLEVLAPRSPLLRNIQRDLGITYVDDQDSDVRTKEENIASGKEITYAKEFFTDEKAQLTQLIKLLQAITNAGAKWSAFQKALDACFKHEAGANILIFTEYRRTQKFLHERLARKYGKDKVALIHGGMSLEERMESAARFNRKDAQFLVSTEAGGEGINLQDECHILFNYDLPWNPMRLHQRIGRLDRYGQKNPVQVFQFYQEGQVEVREGRRSRIVPLVDDRVQEILETKIREVISTIGRLNPGEEPENIREYLLGELAEAKGFSFQKLFQQALVKEDPKAAERLFAQALRNIDNAKIAFSRELAGVPGFALGDYDAIRPEAGMTEVQTFVEAFLRHHRCALKSIAGGAYNVKVPPRLRLNIKIKTDYERLTFNRSLATRDQSLDLLAFGHDFFDVMIERALTPDFGGAATVRYVRAPLQKWKGRSGAEFQFIITFHHHGERSAQEKWVSIFVESDGTVQRELAQQIRLSPSQPATSKAKKQNDTPKWLEQAFEKAQAEAKNDCVRFKDEIIAANSEGAAPTSTLDLFAVSLTHFV